LTARERELNPGGRKEASRVGYQGNGNSTFYKRNYGKREIPNEGLRRVIPTAGENDIEST
jgi:hypothetical protein